MLKINESYIVGL